MERDLKRVSAVFDGVSARRDKSAIYEYWHAIYKLRRKWRRLRKNKGVKIKKIVNRAVQGGIPPSSGDDLLRFIIDATMSTNSKAPTAATRLSKLKSKYFSLLNYVYTQKVATPDVDKFIKDHGGLNFKPGQKLVSSAKRTKQKTGK
jgi:hypothetical protein